MKIFDRSGRLQSFPFALGEQGRGRVYEEVRVDSRRPPTSDDVGYSTFAAGSRSHCVLTAPTGQTGLLLRVSTEGTYTRGTGGEARVVCGSVTELARGEWAWGDAGGIGGGPDVLYHVDGQAIFSVLLAGGEGKGFGRRFIFVDAMRGYVRMVGKRELAQDIATDEDPILSDILRACPEDRLTPTLREALTAARELEAAAEAPATIVQHRISRPLADVAEGLGLRLPPGHTGGLARGSVDGVLVAGPRALVSLTVGPGGGKRYSYEVTEVTGLDVLERRPRRTSGNHCSLEDVAGLATSPDWRVRWSEHKDGELTGEYEASEAGCRGVPWPSCTPVQS
jgi:hypothetical protein